MSLTRTVATLGFSALLVASGLAKANHGYSEDFLLPESVYHAATIGEFLAAILVWTRWQRWVACFCLIAVVAGVVHYWSAGLHGRCGCFGGWPVSRGQHLVILGLLGGSSLVLSSQRSAVQSEAPS